MRKWKSAAFAVVTLGCLSACAWVAGLSEFDGIVQEDAGSDDGAPPSDGGGEASPVEDDSVDEPDIHVLPSTEGGEGTEGDASADASSLDVAVSAADGAADAHGSDVAVSAADGAADAHGSDVAVSVADGAADAHGSDVTVSAADGAADAHGPDVTVSAADGAADAHGPDVTVSAADGAADAYGSDAAMSGEDATPPDANPAGSIDKGIVALYHFDELNGTTSPDSSGNGYTATMEGAVSLSTGVRGLAVALNGVNQYVSLPTGIVSGLTSFSISVWVYITSPGFGDRAFDFGTGTTAYMFLTPCGNTLRYATTIDGETGEEGLDTNITPLAATWQHIAVTQTGMTGTLYLNGVQVAQNTAMTLNPSTLGSTTQNWLGRSQYAGDSYLDGDLDELRIYDRALSAAEVVELYTQDE
jgi:hypothetical protein